MASRKGSSLPDCGGGRPAWRGWCSSSNSVFSGLKREEGLRFFFLSPPPPRRKGTRVLCLFQHGRRSHSQGQRFSRSPGCRVDLRVPRCCAGHGGPRVSFLPWRRPGRGGLLPWLLTAFAQCRFCLSPVTPRVQTEGRSSLCSLDATEAAF